VLCRQTKLAPLGAQETSSPPENILALPPFFGSIAQQTPNLPPVTASTPDPPPAVKSGSANGDFSAANLASALKLDSGSNKMNPSPP